MKILSLRVPDGPHQDVVRARHGPGRSRLGQLVPRPAHVVRGPSVEPDLSATSPGGAGPHVTEQSCPPGRPAPRRPSRPRPWTACGSRSLQPSVRLGLELLELVPDLGLGPPGNLPPDSRPVRTPAERDGTHPGAIRRIPVDRTFAVPTARRSRHNPDCSTDFGSWFGSASRPSRSH
jgi:hypothetical protein